MKEYKWLGAGLAVLLAGLLVRTLVLDQGYWIDEIISIETSRLGFSKLIQRVGFADLHPPAYYILLSVWTSAFGESEIACRLLSLLLSAGTMGVLFYWAGARKGPWVAVTALLLLGLSTFHIHYSVEVRSYPLLAFLATTFLFVYQRISAGADRRREWVLLTVSAALLVLTHYYAAILVLAANVHFFTFRRHPAKRTVRWCLSQGVALAGFGMWLPLLLVQYFHLPAGMFAHLQTQDALTKVALAFGPGPVHPSTIVAWVGAGLYGAAALTALVAGFPTRGAAPVDVEPRSPVGLSRRQTTAAALVLCLLLIGPMLSVAYIEATEATLPLLLQELPLGYVMQFCGVSLLVLGAAFNLRLLRSGHRVEAEPFILALSVLLVCLSFTAGHPFLARNIIFLLPLACYLVASSLKAKYAVTRMAIVAVILSLTVPSLVRHDTAFEPRQDFKGAAKLIGEAEATSFGELATFVLPMWDRPGVEFYLGGGTAYGIMSSDQIPPVEYLPPTVCVVLTRVAFERRREFLEDVTRRLGGGYKLNRTIALRRVFVAVYQRL